MTPSSPRSALALQPPPPLPGRRVRRVQIAATAVTLAWAAAAQAGGAAAGSESTAMLAPRLLSHAASALARHAGAEGPAPQADREAGTATPVRDARAAAQPQAGGLRISRLALLGDERISPLFRAVPGALRDMRERLLTGAAQILHHKSDPVAAPAGRVAAAALSATNPATDPAAEASPDAAPTVRAPAGRGGPAIGLVGRRGDPRPGWNMVADLGLATRTASAP